MLPGKEIPVDPTCMHRKEPAAESIEQLTEESDQNQPTQWIWPIAGGGLGLLS